MKSRVLTAIGLIPFVLGAFFCASPWPLIGLATIVAILGAIELAGLLKTPAVWIGFLWVFAMGSFYPDRAATHDQQLAVIVLFLVGTVSTLVCALRRGNVTLFAACSAPWLFVPLVCLVSLHQSSIHTSAWLTKTPVLLAVLPLWGGDTAALFAGRAFGKHLLAPKISPKKTVEGAFANLVACLGVAIPLALWIGLPAWAGGACGLVAGLLGQAGDLFESHIKRLAGVKDSSTLLPGHGGILDRIDSILFTTPFVWLVLFFVKYP